ncbi:MAG: MurR/RpiR family transcriptional regulator, partial [Planctomycetota bacterium]
MTVQDLIAGVSDRLTPTERRIAEVVAADPTLLAFGTVSDLAERSDTSRPSIVRFATKLGFAGYTELQDWVRDGVSRQLSRPSARIRKSAAERDGTRVEITEALQSVFDAFDDAKLRAMAEPIAHARRVYVFSGETSMAGARALQSGLSMV